MSAFVGIILFALATYPLVFLIFYPALWYAHRVLGKELGRNRGIILFLMGLSIYGPLLLTNLPLPEFKVAFCALPHERLEPRLQPFQFFAPMKYWLSVIVRQGKILNIPFVWESILNFWMLFPAGVLFRILKKRNLLMPLLVGCVSSLFLELTQLTGIWGYIGCAHRVFDVDDIILNTSGFFGGWIAVSLLIWAARRLRRTS